MRKLGLQHEGTKPGYRLRDNVRHTELFFGAEVEHMDKAAYTTLAQTIGLK